MSEVGARKTIAFNSVDSHSETRVAHLYLKKDVSTVLFGRNPVFGSYAELGQPSECCGQPKKAVHARWG